MTAVESALETLALGAADAGRRQAPHRALPGRGGPVRAGRAGHRGPLDPRRRRPGRARTASGWPSTARARSSASGPTSRAGVRTSSNIAVTPCRVAMFDADLHRPLAPRGAVGGPSPRGPGARLNGCASTFCGTRGSTPAPGPEFVRYGGHTSCVALSHDGPGPARPTLLLDAGTGPPARARAPRRRAVPRHRAADPPALGPRAGACPSFAAATVDDARVTLLAARRGGTARRRGAAGADDVAAVLPDRADATPRRLDVRTVARRRLRGRAASSCTALDVPHKGGRTFGFRVSDGRTSIAYIPDHCPRRSAPAPKGWASTTRPPSNWPAASTC